jgi:CubicO group peptidase (beta-lactamase class C family)
MIPSTHALTSAEQVDQTNRTRTEAWPDETITRQLEDYRVPGAAVVMVGDGEVVLAKGYGYADIES